MCYAEEHNYVYPTFHEFSTTIQNKARKKNHPNVSAGSPATNPCAQDRRRENNQRHFPQSGDEVKQALMDQDSGNVPEKGPQSPQVRNIVYFTKELATSLWSAKPFTRWRSMRRWSGSWGKDLVFVVSSLITQPARARRTWNVVPVAAGWHHDLLHLSIEEKKERAKEAETANEAQENINAKCTSICKGAPGGLSCSKIVLMDIYRGSTQWSSSSLCYCRWPMYERKYESNLGWCEDLGDGSLQALFNKKGIGSFVKKVGTPERFRLIKRYMQTYWTEIEKMSSTITPPI